MRTFEEIQAMRIAHAASPSRVPRLTTLNVNIPRYANLPLEEHEQPVLHGADELVVGAGRGGVRFQRCGGGRRILRKRTGNQ